MAGLFEGSLAGPGYVILNVIRAINIIAFLDIIAASVVMLIKISLNSSFFFFEAVTHVVTASVSIFLIVSELPVLEHYFVSHWPQLGQESGFVVLSFLMIVLGVSVVGNLNNESFSHESLGMAFWRIIASAGILSMTMGIVNFGASFIFRDSKNDVTARQVRTHGAVADKVLNSKSSQKSFQLSLSREDDTLPTYRASPRPMSLRNATRFPLRISSPVNERHETATKSTPEPDLAFPNLAHHPAMHSNFV